MLKKINILTLVILFKVVSFSPVMAFDGTLASRDEKAKKERADAKTGGNERLRRNTKEPKIKRLLGMKARQQQAREDQMYQALPAWKKLFWCCMSRRRK